MSMKHPDGKMCVGCAKRSKACRVTTIGTVCPACLPLLAEVIVWSGEAHKMDPPPQPLSLAERRMIHTRGTR